MMPTTVDRLTGAIDAATPKPGDVKWLHDEKGARAEGITDRRITSIDALVEFFKIDLRVWKIKQYECAAYESHVKIRRYDHGRRTDDEHKVVPLYRVWARLEENRPLILLSDVKAEILEEIKAKLPKRPAPIRYPKHKDGVCLEVTLFDLHFGKLVWDEEAGDNYDIKIAREVFNRAVGQLLAYSRMYHVEQIVFPVGNDFFNVDNSANTTTGGTKQDEDTRWKKTFKAGRILLSEAIIQMASIAPVYVPVIPGNHDAERAFYLGDSLECRFFKYPSVTIDNGAKVRKYYRYGANLIGYAHGKEEKEGDLPTLMAQEAPALWAATKYREFHLGDKHHKKEIHWKSTEEYKGVVVRYMRSLASTDVWHYGKGYVGNVRAGEAFIWHPKAGLVCQLTAAI